LRFTVVVVVFCAGAAFSHALKWVCCLLASLNYGLTRKRLSTNPPISLIHAINTTPEENCAGKVETRKYIVVNTYLRKPTSYYNCIYPFIHIWFSQYILCEFCEISHCVPPNIPPRWRC